MIAFAVIAISGPFLVLASRPERFELKFDLRDWQLEVSETERRGGKYDTVVVVTRYHFGPISLTAHHFTTRRDPL